MALYGVASSRPDSLLPEMWQMRFRQAEECRRLPSRLSIRIAEQPRKAFAEKAEVLEQYKDGYVRVIPIVHHRRRFVVVLAQARSGGAENDQPEEAPVPPAVEEIACGEQQQTLPSALFFRQCG